MYKILLSIIAADISHEDYWTGNLILGKPIFQLSGSEAGITGAEIPN